MKSVVLRFPSLRNLAITPALAWLALGATISVGAAKATNVEREAAVYLTGDLSRSFTISYQVGLQPASSNRSWTTIGLTFLGRAETSASVEVGLARGPSPAGRLTAFVSVTGVKSHPAFRGFDVDCTMRCVLTLRGDANTLSAAINAEVVAEWTRSEIHISNSLVQLNAEVLKPGDKLSAVFVPIRLVTNGELMQSPACGLTARGIEPRVLPDGVIAFSGTYHAGARSALVLLNTGRHVDRCASAPFSARIRNVSNAAFRNVNISAIFHAPNASGSTRISAQTMA